MNAGQMLEQMPVGMGQTVAMQAPSTAALLPARDQKTSAFAGVLRAVSPRESDKPTSAAVAAKSAQAKTPHSGGTVVDPVQPKRCPDAAATLSARPGAKAKDVDSDGRESGDSLEADVAKMTPDAQLPQNVVLCAAESQIAAALQINGRMPEVERAHAGHGGESGSSDRKDVQSLSSASATLEKASAKLQGAPFFTEKTQGEDAAVTMLPEEGTDVAGEQNASGTTEVVRKTVSSLAVPQNAAGSITDNDPKGNSSAVMPSSSGSTKTTSTPQPGLKNISVRIDSETEAVQNATTKTATNSAAAPALAELTASEVSPVHAEESVSGSSNRSNLDAYFQTSVRSVSVTVEDSSSQAAQAATPLPIVGASADIHPATDPGKRSAHGEVQPNVELMPNQEQQVVRQGSTGGAAKNESFAVNAVAGSVKEAATTTSGEEFDQNGNGFGNKGMSGNAHLAMSHQVKFDNASPTDGTSAVAASDPLRTNLAEQVVNQVKEHLAGREIKLGVEQVVIRLSPENLGELKMNLRMENQCLKVEIVTETTMVRDTLMKHSDTLKESLARQNITMETFDVSTGSNKQGTASQGQGDWRELARQRQNNAWTFAGGYKLDPVQITPNRPHYQASSDHSMVDVHF